MKGRSPRSVRLHGGFTFLELVTVLAIGALLTSIAVHSFGTVSSRFAAKGARQSFAAMQARARAHAVERGDIARLNVDPAGDSVWIAGPSGTIERLHLGGQRGVDVQSDASGVVTLCMNSRGIGETRCNSFGSSPVKLAFVQGGQTAAVTVLPLGMIQW